MILTFIVVVLVTTHEGANADESKGTVRQLLSFIVSPIRATIERAKKLLNHRLEDVSNGVDLVRLEIYKMYMQMHNKTYSASEIPRRMALFFARRDFIVESVKAFEEGRLPFKMRETGFIDWTDDELNTLRVGISLPQSAHEMIPEERRLLLGNQEETPVTPTTPTLSDNFGGGDSDDLFMVKAESIPASKDWRTSGCIATPIDQQKCGACYAIATMGVVEAMRCLNQIEAPILSSQQIVDCTTPRTGYSNHGCNGGWPTKVLKYLKDVQVAARETCYPFVRKQNSCKLRKVREEPGCIVSSSPSNTRLKFKVLSNEQDVLYHVAKTGPVATVIQAPDSFLYFGSGIYDDKSCTRRRHDVDHAIIIVGYGRENNQDYWLIKNSWGTTSWGEQGYGKIRRGKYACSIGHWGWVVTS